MPRHQTSTEPQGNSPARVKQCGPTRIARPPNIVRRRNFVNVLVILLSCQTPVHHDLPNRRQRRSEKPRQSEPRTTHADPCGEKVPEATCDHSATVVSLMGHLLQGLRQPRTFCQRVSFNLLIKGTGGFPVAQCRSLHVHDVGTSQPRWYLHTSINSEDLSFHS